CCLIAAVGGTPPVAASLYFFVAAAIWVLVGIDQLRRYHEFPLAIATPDLSELRKAVPQFAQYWIAGLSQPIVLNIPIILLGMWGAPGAAVSYSVCRTLTGIIRQVTNQPNSSMGVEMARLHAIGDSDGLIKLFTSASRLTAGISGILAGVILVIAEPFTRLWTHGQVAYSSLLTLVFVITIAAVAPSQPAFFLFHYLNRP